MPGTVVHTPLIPALGKLRQENYHEFKDSLGYMRFCLKSKQAKNKNKTNKQTKNNKELGEVLWLCRHEDMSHEPQHLRIKTGCGPGTPVTLVLISRDDWMGMGLSSKTAYTI